MQASDSDSDTIRPTSSIEESAVPPGGAPAGPSWRIRLWGWTLGAGMAAGLVSWLGGEACVGLIQPPRHAVSSRGRFVRLASRHDEAVAAAKNAGLAFALLGAALGTGLGIAGGLARRSGRAAVVAGLLGLVVGAAAGSGMSLALLPVYNATWERDPDALVRDITLPLVVHVGVWSVIGAAGGLALGIGHGQRSRLGHIVLAGCAGAALGAVVYEVIGAACFPGARTAQLLSTTWETRLLARLAITVLASLGAVLVVSEPAERPASPAA